MSLEDAIDQAARAIKDGDDFVEAVREAANDFAEEWADVQKGLAARSAESRKVRKNRITAPAPSMNGSAHPRNIQESGQLGFADTDRRAAGHDDITLWVDAHRKIIARAVFPFISANSAYLAACNKAFNKYVTTQCAKKLADLAELREQPSEFSSSYSQRRIAELEGTIAEFSSWADIPDPGRCPGGTIDAHTLEYALTQDIYNGGTRVVGFIDLFLKVTYIASGAVWPNPEDYEKEYPTPSWPPAWHWEQERARLCFDSKTTIPSVSEVIRQIRFYESQLPAKYFIVSPDCRSAQVFLDQGIGFIEYRPDALPGVFLPGSSFNGETESPGGF